MYERLLALVKPYVADKAQCEFLAVRLEDLTDTIYEEGFQKGYNQGHKAGLEEGAENPYC